MSVMCNKIEFKCKYASAAVGKKDIIYSTHTQMILL